jgi:hypothetical protein
MMHIGMHLYVCNFCRPQVLRTAGYFRQALWVAEAAGQSDWMLDILMEDLAAYDDALALLVGLYLSPFVLSH